MDSLHGYSYPNKHHNILVFKEIQSKTGIVKQYIHPINTKLSAYARQLSSQEQSSQEAIQNNVTIEFVINYRTIDIDMFIEFMNRVYAIDSIDELEFFQTELKLRAYPVNSKSYTEVRWS
jgi:head-tail adaptor